jgi:glycosyltransferase involved in cell wall biosynthesis
MKAVFVHDHKFKHADGQFYSNAFHGGLWCRYLPHFDSLTVVGRDGGARGDGKEIDASSPGVTIQLWPNLSPIRLFRRHRIRRKLAAVISQNDAVIVRLPSEYGLMAASLARDLGKPCLVEVVGCARDAFSHHGSPAARLYAPVAAHRVKRAVERAGFILYVSQDFLRRRYPSGAAAFWVSASNVELPPAQPETLAMRLSRINEASGRVRLGLVGSLSTRYKGVHTAIEALASLRATRLEMELHVLGPGQSGPWQALADRSGVGAKVFFHAPLPAGQAVLEWLDGIDIYLQPSLTEGVPRSLIEAMSRGCPAVASAVGGIPELLPAEYLVEPEDATGLAKTIRELAGDKARMQHEASRNFQKALEFDGALLASKRDGLVKALAQAAAQTVKS